MNEQYQEIIEGIPNQLKSLGIDDFQNNLSKQKMTQILLNI